MRGRTTWLLLAALIGLGLAAAMDALRGGDRKPEGGRAVATTSPAADLRRADVTGVLYFSVGSEGRCRLRALSLPSLQDAASFELESCRFDVSPEGSVVAGPPCPGGPIEVRPVDGLASSWRGCAPAWKPTGGLTFVREGDVVTPRGTLIRRVTRFARFALGTRELAVRQLAWLSDTRLAILVGARAVQSDVIVVVQEGKLVSEPIFVAEGSTMYVSQNREEIFVGGSGFAFQVFDRRGTVVSPSRFPFQDVAAVADSPDGRWIALARPNNVCIYRETKPPPRERFPVTCLSFDAVDLAWL